MKFRKMRQTIKKIKVENVVFNNIFGLIRFRTMLLASISICFGGKESNGDVLKSVAQTRLPDLTTRLVKFARSHISWLESNLTDPNSVSPLFVNEPFGLLVCTMPNALVQVIIRFLGNIFLPYFDLTKNEANG